MVGEEDPAKYNHIIPTITEEQIIEELFDTTFLSTHIDERRDWMKLLIGDEY